MQGSCSSLGWAVRSSSCNVFIIQVHESLFVRQSWCWGRCQQNPSGFLDCSRWFRCRRCITPIHLELSQGWQWTPRLCTSSRDTHGKGLAWFMRCCGRSRHTELPHHEARAQFQELWLTRCPSPQRTISFLQQLATKRWWKHLPGPSQTAKNKNWRELHKSEKKTTTHPSTQVDNCLEVALRQRQPEQKCPTSLSDLRKIGRAHV